MTTNQFDFQTMLSNIMGNAKNFQQNMAEMYKELSEKQQNRTVEGKAGIDLVTATVNLKFKLVKLDFKPELFNESPEIISELIMGAINMAIDNAQVAMKEEMTALGKKMGLPSDMPLPFGSNVT